MLSLLVIQHIIHETGRWGRLAAKASVRHVEDAGSIPRLGTLREDLFLVSPVVILVE